MKSFLALLRLQLLSRYADMKPRNLKTALKEKKGRTIGMIIAVIFAIAYLGGMLFYLETQMIDILIRLHMPEMLVTLAVVLATTGTLIMAFFFTLSVLYLGRDATYLASLPIKPRTLLSAKLTQVWISETCIDALLILPVGVRHAAYGDPPGKHPSAQDQKGDQDVCQDHAPERSDRFAHGEHLLSPRNGGRTCKL